MKFVVCSVFIIVMSLLVSGVAFAAQGGKWHGNGVYRESHHREGASDLSLFKELRFVVGVEVDIDASDNGVYMTIHEGGGPCTVQLYSDSSLDNNDILGSYSVSTDPVRGLCGSLCGGHVSMNKDGGMVTIIAVKDKARLDAMIVEAH